jgi:hypothetical protein
LISLITLLGNTVSVVNLLTTPAPQSVSWSFQNSVSVVQSIFTGQVQTQTWPGADAWSGTVTYAPLTQAQADPIIAALMQCQGMTNAIQIGDPLKTTPRGNVQGTPVVNGTTPTGQPAMTPGAGFLYTRGWTPSQTNLLLPGDYIQVAYRYYRVLDAVNSDSNGDAPINIWPTLREVPIDGQAIVTDNPLGLFRLGSNKGTWSSDVTKLTRLSFQIQEYR